MQSQKLDAELNLALSLSFKERERSGALLVGFEPISRSWDLIVRYIGDISFLEQQYGAVITYLLGGYAIINIAEYYIDQLVIHDEIIYVEKPNNIYVNVRTGIQVSCINRVQVGAAALTGSGVIVAIIDSGIDYAHPDFRNEDGSSRILALWDQTAREGEPPEGYRIGTLYSEEQINEALGKIRVNERLAIVPEVDLSGHGTFVAGVAAGNGRASAGENRGVAYGADLLVVKLGNPAVGGFPRTVELMQAVDYVVRFANERRQPLSINLSFGNNYGSHDGTSLLETYLNQAVDASVGSIAIGTGNEGDSDKHTFGTLKQNIAVTEPFGIGANEAGVSLQLWKAYVDDFFIYLIAPDNSQIGPLPQTIGVQRYQLMGTEIDVYYDMPKPYQQPQIIFFDFVPQGQFLAFGEWRIRLEPRKIVVGRYDMWLPVSGAVSPDTRFLLPNSEGSFTIPSPAVKGIAVGAYNSRTDAVASFSGRGEYRLSQDKPDLVAPGVDILSCSPGGGYTVKSGTSMATPFVTGAAALLMEWGIVRENDTYLYGEKLKSFLLKGARVLPGYDSVPNIQIGFGALCLASSFPEGSNLFTG